MAVAKQRGYPDRRGLWAESDSISEMFVPSEKYKAQQKMMAEALLAAGVSLEKIKDMLSSQFELSGEQSSEPLRDDTSEKVSQDVPPVSDVSEPGSRS